jgi:undecaprenyl-diphosphatase
MMAMGLPGDPSQPIGPAWVEEAFRDFTGLGGVGVLGLATLATLGYLWLRGMRRAALHVLLAVGDRLPISPALKAGFRRPRPDLI